HVVAPWEFSALRCDQGTTGETGGCTVEQPEPGHLVVHSKDLGSGAGLTLYAEHGASLPTGTPPLPDPPAEAPPDPGAGIAMPAAFAAVATVGSGLSMSRFVRRRGRERVGVGGAADAAWAGGGGPTSERLLDAEELAELATTDFAPPAGLTAPMGGIVLCERVTNEHKTAWLIEAAIAGAIDLDEPDKGAVRLVRKAPGDSATKPILDAAFGGRSELTLGKYDPTFATGWGRIDGLLDGWSHQSGLWDPAGDRRKTRFRVVGVLGVIVGILLVGAGGAAAGLFGEGWIALVVAGGLTTGVAWAAVIRSWELRVRTTEGSARWLRVESFRRFLAGSEAFHAE
ncbi:MAG: DUF2207 domain-containing protein, partial [Acidimicrobiales bacterium]|nr:DUF2207 domain-containing protein [Acidimicrobiales bacterium]